MGVLQFDVTIARLRDEYGVDAEYSPINYSVARWVTSDTPAKLTEFERKHAMNMATDSEGRLCFLTTSEWQLGFAKEQHPDVVFHKTREYNSPIA